MFNSLQDAKTALFNSGCYEWFDYDDLESVAKEMYLNDKSAEQVAEDRGLLN